MNPINIFVLSVSVYVLRYLLGSSEHAFTEINAGKTTDPKWVVKVNALELPKFYNWGTFFETLLICFPFWAFSFLHSQNIKLIFLYISLSVFFAPFQFPSSLSPTKQDTSRIGRFVFKWILAKHDTWVKYLIGISIVFLLSYIPFVDRLFESFSTEFYPPSLLDDSLVDFSTAFLVVTFVLILMRMMMLWSYGKLKGFGLMLIYALVVPFSFTLYFYVLNKNFVFNESIIYIFLKAFFIKLIIDFAIDYFVVRNSK